MNSKRISDATAVAGAGPGAMPNAGSNAASSFGSGAQDGKHSDKHPGSVPGENPGNHTDTQPGERRGKQRGNRSAAARRLGLPRLLVLGCGDVGLRLLPLLRGRYRVFAVARDPAHVDALRAAGAVPVLADLDRRADLRRLAGLAHAVIHLAPPPAEGGRDRRTRHVTAILPEAARVVYVSTTGVYGDLGGRFVDETRPVAPRNDRAWRRVDAEGTLRRWAAGAGGRLSIVRVPGIYASDRLPLERLRRGTPALAAADDVYTNHIHADDLAAILLAALRRGRPQRIYHAVDDTELRMADYFDAVADAFGLPRPPRLPRAELAQAVSPALLSFMSESRRLANARLKKELRVRLRYPSVAQGLQEARASRVRGGVDSVD